MLFNEAKDFFKTINSRIAFRFVFLIRKRGNSVLSCAREILNYLKHVHIFFYSDSRFACSTNLLTLLPCTHKNIPQRTNKLHTATQLCDKHRISLSLHVITYPHKWTGRSVSRRTCHRRPRTPHSGLYPSRRNRSASTRPDSRESKANAHLPSNYRESRVRGAGGQGLSEGKAPGLRPRRKLALRAWWCRLRSRGEKTRDALVCQGSRFSRDWARVGPGRAAPPLARWPAGAGSEGPATSTPAPSPRTGVKIFQCYSTDNIRLNIKYFKLFLNFKTCFVLMEDYGVCLNSLMRIVTSNNDFKIST